MTKKHDLFKKLLTQIKLPAQFANDEVLQTGQVEDVDVYAEKREWIIHVFFDTPLSFATYQALAEGIQQTFSPMVKASLLVKTKDGDRKYLPDYWQYVIDHADLPTMVQKVLANEKPVCKQDQWMITVQNQVEQEFLTNQALLSLGLEYRKYGFFNVKFILRQDQANRDAQLESLAEEQEAHAAQMQEVYQNMPEPAPHPAPATTKRHYGPKKLDEHAPITQMKNLADGASGVVIEGHIFNCELRQLRSGAYIFTGEITDYTDSIAFKRWVRDDEQVASLQEVKPGMWAKMQGSVMDDRYQHDLVFNIDQLEIVEHVGRQEKYEGDKKRVELHLHTNMSQLDATNTATDFIKTAKKFGQTAIAITDHGDVQSFPEAYHTGDSAGMKILYGDEAYMVNDDVKLVLNPQSMDYRGREFVIFDTETTGLSAVYDTMIEIGAVKMKDGEVLERFDEFINPHHPLSSTTINLTSITDELVSKPMMRQTWSNASKNFAGTGHYAGTTFNLILALLMLL